MKKVLSVILCLMLCMNMLPVLAAESESEPTIIMSDDFSTYQESAVISTGLWTNHIKNDTIASSGKAYKDGDNMVVRFSIDSPTSSNQTSGPELHRTVDITGMEDLTISCRAKQSGGTKCELYFRSDNANNTKLAEVSATTWTDIKAELDFVSMTYTVTVGSSTTSGNLGEIVDLTSCGIGLKQTINPSRFAYWDDVLITSETAPNPYTKDESEWFAWTIPDEEKAKGTAIDASFLLEKPAGKHGFVQVDGDKFVFEDGTPARFWGTNVVFNANYMSYEDSETLADRIARSGYNIVRLHMIDTSTQSPDIFESGTTREFDETMLDRLFYFTAELKERGVYIYMDLLVERKAYAADGIEAVEDVDNKGWQVESHYDDYLRELQKEYADMLLTTENPYTGLAYKDDPQMAMVGIANESGVVSIMNDSSLYPTTEYYQNILNTKFNTWVHTKYTSGDALATAWAEDGKIGLMDDESYDENTIRFPSTPNSTNYSAARRRDHSEFLMSLELDYYSEMSDYLKDTVGIKCPCTGSAIGGSGATAPNIYANAKTTDYVSRNSYYGKNTSTLFNAAHVESMSSSRVYGKPYILTEWCVYEPSPYIAESTLLMSSYAQLQGWNMIQFQMWHKNSLPASQAEINTTFVEYQHPVRTALAPATGQNFLRGDITENTTEYYYSKTYADATDPTSVGIPPYQNTGIYAKSGLMYNDVETNAAASDETVLAGIEAKMSGETAANISEQIYWDTKKADFRVETEYTQGVAGFRKTAVELEYVTFDMDNTYYTAILNSMTKKTIENSDRMLLSVASHAHNTGREVSSDYATIINNGTGPVLVEPVTGTVTLKLDREVEVYALTSSGERKEQLTVTTDENGYTSFELTSTQQTLNYEICSVGYGKSALFEISNAERTESGADFILTNTGDKAGSTIVVMAAYNGNALVELKLQSVTLAPSESEDLTAVFTKTGYTRIRLFSLADFFSMRISAAPVEI